MGLKRGDHVCAVYSTTTQLVQEAATFIADGLRKRERCWYVGVGPEIEALREALVAKGVDVAGETARHALRFVAGEAAYVVHGRFDPEVTLRVFNDAIEQACTDGHTGFRAAAEMSWVLSCDDGAHQVIVYEALLKALFAGCRATGLCLYDRSRMPLAVVNGALATHPIVGAHGHYVANPFYEATTTSLATVKDRAVLDKLATLDSLRAD